MDLFCPHCTKRVAIPDDKAGQVLTCPLCAKQFMAPSLAPPPGVPKPPAPPSAPTPDETFSLSPASAPPPSVATTSTPAPSRPAAEAAPPPPPPPPGEYTRTRTCELTGAWLAFVPLFCLVAIFVLSFFTWHLAIPTPTENNLKEVIPAANMWSLVLATGQGHFLGYAMFMFFGGILCVGALLLEKKVFPIPPQIGPFVIFKDLVVGLVLGLAFLMLCFDYLNGNLGAHGNPIAVSLKLAFRLHFVAVIACFVMLWLGWRKKHNLPPPKCEMRW